MSAEEKKLVNQKLADVARAFGLQVKLTISNAQKLIEENYQRIREIDNRIQDRITSMNVAV